MTDKFDEDIIKSIKTFIRLDQLAKFAVDSFSRRGELMKPGHEKDIKTREQWQKVLYRIYMNVKQARADDPSYQDYVKAIDNLIKSRREERKLPKQKAPKPFEQSLRDYPESPKHHRNHVKKHYRNQVKRKRKNFKMLQVQLEMA